jgi:hypothetical protein
MKNVPYPEYYGLIGKTSTIHMQFKSHSLQHSASQVYLRILFFLEYTNNFVAVRVIIILATN